MITLISTNFFMPTRLIIGEGAVKNNPQTFAELGNSCMIITGGNSAKASGALDDVCYILEEAGIRYTVFNEVTQNPYLSTCVKAAELLKQNPVDFLVGIGGGSPQDATKAIAILANNDLPENTVFNGGWANSALPFILVGTTSGTGSEVTPYAVITDEYTSSKRSIASPQCYAVASFGDPAYTMGLPEKFTISTAIDALSHCVEGYFNKKADSISDLFAVEGIKIISSILPAIKGLAPQEVSAQQRQQLYLASIYGGITIARTGTCYCHSLGYYLTEQHSVAHGFACGVYLPSFIRRAAELDSARAQKLSEAVGISTEALCDVIENLNLVEKIKLSDEIKSHLAIKYSSTNNYKNALGSFDADEAKALLDEIFAEFPA